MQTFQHLVRASSVLLFLVCGLSVCRSQTIGTDLGPNQAVLEPSVVASSPSAAAADKTSQFSNNKPDSSAVNESAGRLQFFGDRPVYEGMADSPIFTAQDSPSVRERLSIMQRILTDHHNYYSPESLTMLGAGLVVGGAMANSSIDSGIQRHFQSSIRSANSDDWFEGLHASKELGNGKYTLPVLAGSWAVGELFPDSPIAHTTGIWGERSLRGILVGAPPLLALQQLTGGSRPTETHEGPEWHPLTDNNGISGHSFMGSLPFITAAKMTESRSLKATYYAASTIVPLSRMNDNAHYPSQVALGWWMAYLAASAVDATDHPDSRWKFYPYSTGDSSGILAEFKY